MPLLRRPPAVRRWRLPEAVGRSVDRMALAVERAASSPVGKQALDATAAVVGLVLLAALGVWHATGIVPSRWSLAAIDVLAIAGVFAAWRRLGDRLPTSPEPSVGLVRDLALAASLAVAVFAGIDWFLLGEAGFLPDLVEHRWPVSALTGSLLAAVALGAVFVVGGVLHRLRRLLYETPTRAVRRSWALMVAAIALDALVAVPALGLTQEVPEMTQLASVLLMLWNAGHQGWIVTLPRSRKWAVVALGSVLGLAAAFTVSISEELLVVLSPSVQRLVGSGLLYASLNGFLSAGYALLLLPSTQAVRRQVEERKALRSLTDLMGEAFDRERLVDAIVQAPVGAGLADRAWLVLGTGDDARVAAAHGIGLDEAAERSSPTFLATTRWSGPALASALSLPLVTGGRATGALVAERNSGVFFTRDDADSLGVFASQAAFAFEHARLFEQTVEKERLRREMDIARAVQQRLLPQTLPTLDGASLAATSVPALDVGGDYFDVIRTGDDGLALVVADVSGKGTSAAFFMAEMQGAMRALAPGAVDPVACLADANRVLAGVLDPGHFVTALLGLLRVDAAGAATLTSARAGHCPLALAAPGVPVRFVRSPGLGLGLDRRGRHFAALTRPDTLRLDPGTAVVFVTDGVVESRDASGEEYGYDRLARAIEHARTHWDASDAASLHDALLADLGTFVAGGEYGDDMTLLVLVWHGRPSPTGSHAGTPHTDAPRDRAFDGPTPAPAGPGGTGHVPAAA